MPTIAHPLSPLRGGGTVMGVGVAGCTGALGVTAAAGNDGGTAGPGAGAASVSAAGVRSSPISAATVSSGCHWAMPSRQTSVSRPMRLER